jgi:hypothetical protein
MDRLGRLYKRQRLPTGSCVISEKALDDSRIIPLISISLVTQVFLLSYGAKSVLHTVDQFHPFLRRCAGVDRARRGGGERI